MNVAGIVIACHWCGDSGWTYYDKKVNGRDGSMAVIRIPTPCRYCDHGANYKDQFELVAVEKLNELN